MSDVKNILWQGLHLYLDGYNPGGNHLEPIRQDVVCCHGEDRGSCRDTGERTTGPSNVNVGVWQRCVRVHTMLYWM